MNDFSGFGPQTVKFIGGLSGNNSKQWFESHREDYEAHYIEPAKAFVAALGEPLHGMAPAIQAIPKVNGSIFRINRDIRFSKDKTPYKDHLDLWFWEGERKGAISGLFFRLTKDRLILGAGAHMFPADLLKKYREALTRPAKAKSLLEIETGLSSAGLQLNGEHYARTPRGLSFDDEGLERLSRYNALYTSAETPHPDSLNSAKFIDHCISQWRMMVPLHRWLIDAL